MSLNSENLIVRRPENKQEEWMRDLSAKILLLLAPSMLLGFKLGEFITFKTYDNFYQFLNTVCAPELTAVAGSACYQGSYSTYSGIYVFLVIAISILLVMLILLLLEFIFCPKGIKKGFYQTWLLQRNDKIVGDLFIWCDFTYTYYFLDTIMIKPKFQNQGYGSYFLKAVLQNELSPMYVLPVPRAS
jgi:Acetyltransferase (GNAT) family